MKTIVLVAIASALSFACCGCTGEVAAALSIACLERSADKGADGKDGVDGTDGVPGSEGPQGPQGVQGPQGIQGPAGEVGPQGPKGDTGTSLNKSGSRLKAVVLSGDDGSQQFYRFHDNQLDVDCAFSTAKNDDATRRCYPVYDGSFDEFTDSFSDPQCVYPLVYTKSDAKYVRSSDNTILKLTQVQIQGQYYSKDVFGSCVEQGGYGEDGAPEFTLFLAVPADPSKFVLGTPVIVP